jgi:hypothetical protein
MNLSPFATVIVIGAALAVFAVSPWFLLVFAGLALLAALDK